MVPGILLAGEPMGLYIAQEEGPLDRAATFRAARGGRGVQRGGGADPRGIGWSI